ncbi:MAG TPA: SMP-30/gluconolactonase/LRE family protein [Pirellulales bacterium]|nr:SMP-30/gluconolactonase/LRE family protein [Pirellulales bacterium]
MRRYLLFIAAITLLAATGDVTAEDAEAPKPIVPADAKLELIYTRSAPILGGLTEGPAVAPDGSIYFSDIPTGQHKGLILRFDPSTKETSTFTDDSHKANGLMFDARGFLIACEGADGGGRCVSRWDVKTGKREVLADQYLGKRFNAPNDLCIDLKGRIYFTDPRYLGDEPRELEHRAVYRVDPDGALIEVTHDVEKPNGIALSADQKTLYVADNNNGTDRIDPAAPPPEKGAMKIYAFPLGENGLVAGDRRTIYDFARESGCDGMTLDTKGNLYLAARSVNRPGILIIDPAGHEVGFIATGQPQPDAKEPRGLPSNCDFGLGDESDVLYVTVDMSLYRIRLNATGFHIPWEK